MHNVKRTKPGTYSDAELAERERHEKARLETYLELEDRFFALRSEGAKNTEALEATTALLSCNPEYYSAWNYRREVLQELFKQDESGNAQAHLLTEDLELTQQFLRRHPKVYWLWNHRRWCLVVLPAPEAQDGQAKWRKELGLVEMMLEMDPRNFMGWNYRRWVIAHLAAQLAATQGAANAAPFPASLSDHALAEGVKQAQLALARKELDYTMRHIEANFSNFSAWHYRSKLLPRVWDAEQLNTPARTTERAKEFELLQQAMYTDPSDQSIWIYHRWLLAQEPERRTVEDQIRVVEELAEVEPNSKWCLLSLAHCKQLLLERYANELGSDTQAKLHSEVAALLKQLQRTDVLRRARYQDLLEAMEQKSQEVSSA